MPTIEKLVKELRHSFMGDLYGPQGREILDDIIKEAARLAVEISDRDAIIHDLREDRDLGSHHLVSVWSEGNQEWINDAVYHTMQEALRHVEKFYDEEGNETETIAIEVWEGSECTSIRSFQGVDHFQSHMESRNATNP